MRGRDAEQALGGPRESAESWLGKKAGFGPWASNLDSREFALAGMTTESSEAKNEYAKFRALRSLLAEMH